jgi:hypothetical protein
VKWYLYGKMESIVSLGATDAVPAVVNRDGEDVDVGDIEIQPGHRVRGRITLSDGAAIADGMRVTISAQRVWDSQTVLIGRDGWFQFLSVPTGKYEILPSVRGYKLPGDAFTIQTSVEKDIDDFAVALSPDGRR